MIQAWFRLVTLFCLSLLLFVSGKVYADYEIETAYSLGMGPRVDNLDWSIAGDLNGENPNILSELTWTDLEIAQIKGDFKIAVGKSMHFFYLRTTIAYGEIMAGDNQDSDYFGDNRTIEFSRSNNSSDSGYVSDASFGMGYQLRLFSGRIKMAPIFGYSSSRQNLRMTDGFQTVPLMGSFEGLNSTYETQWRGPWIGLDISAMPINKIELFGKFEYHWADYHADGNWNLRSELAHPISFEHDADGTGIVVSAGGAYNLNERWSLKVYLDIKQWSTNSGLDRVFTVNGGYADTSLNEVNWDSFATGVEVTYKLKAISRPRQALYY